MAFLSSLNIPLSGMTAERFRLDIIAQNVANADNVASTPEEAYKRQMVVFGEDKTFKSVLATKLGTGETHYHKYIKYRGVEAKQVVDDPTPAEPVYDPTHPLADTSMNPTWTLPRSSLIPPRRRTCIPPILRCSRW